MKLFRLIAMACLLAWPRDGWAVETGPVEDLGRVRAGKEVIHDFALRNTTTQPLKISKVTTDCSCTTVVSYPEKLEAGKTGVLKVRFAPDKIAKYDVQIAVLTDRKEGMPMYRMIATSMNLPDPEQVAQSRVSAAAIREEMSKGSALTFVDIRPSEAFVETHLPGAIQLPLHGIRAMQAWKKRQIVIVDELGGIPLVFDTIAQLQKEGFTSVRVLEGGLRGWQLAGGSLEGTNPQALSVAVVSPSAFAQVQTDNGWLVIDASAGKTPMSFADGVSVKRITSRNPKELASDIQAEAAKSKSKAVLVVSDNGGSYMQLEPLVRKESVPVYYLAGGREEWSRATKQQQLIASGHKVTLESGATHGAGGSIKSGAGCGGCGK